MEFIEDEIGQAFSYLDEIEDRPRRLNTITGTEWWVFINDSFNFTFPDSKGVERRFRFRISDPSTIEWNHPDDVIILDRADVSEHGGIDLTVFAHDHPLDCKINFIQRSGNSLHLSTFGNGSFEITPSRRESDKFTIRRLVSEAA